MPQDARTRPLTVPSSEIEVTNSPAGTAAFLLDTLQEPQPAWIRFKERMDQNPIVMNFFIILFLNGLDLYIKFMLDLFNNCQKSFIDPHMNSIAVYEKSWIYFIVEYGHKYRIFP